MQIPTDTAGMQHDTLVLGGCAAMRQVFAGSCFRLVTFRCLHDGGEMWTERSHPSPSLLIGFSGASLLTTASHTVQADPASAVWHRPHEGYRTRHPWGCTCRGCYVVLTPELAAELDRRPGGTGPRSFSLDAGTLLEIRRMIAWVERGEAVEPLGIEEALLRVVGNLLSSGLDSPPGPRHAATASIHEACVARARAFLQERFRDRLHLIDVSRAACASPDHLTRVFRRETGVTLHEYLMRLRLATALDTVLEGEGDLTELALELGFANHSHLTYAFRRRFGLPPAAVRRELGRRAHGRRPLTAARETPVGPSGLDARPRR